MEDNEKELDAKQLEKRYISQLNSGNSKVIVDTISEIRKKGDITILPDVINLILGFDDNDVLQAATALLNDLKDKEARQYIIAALKDRKYESIQEVLLASCWQNGMDYHEHIELFIDIFIASDYIKALEAFTVIEENIAQCDDNERLLVLNKLKSHDEAMTNEKDALLQSLIEVIKSI